MRRRKNEPALCPDCPYKPYWNEIALRLLRRQYTREKEMPSNLKICMELRRIFGPCKYYPASETLLAYMSSPKKEYVSATLKYSGDKNITR